jgi:hypothetical protein
MVELVAERGRRFVSIMLPSTRSSVFWLGLLLNTACYGSGTSDDEGGAGGMPNTGGGGASSGGSSAKGGSPAKGGSTGSAGAGVGGTGSGGGFSECVDTPSDVTADEVTALGFSANDVLAAVGGTRETDLLWMPSDLYATHSLAGTVTPLTLTVANAVTASRYIDSQGGGCVGGDGPCFVCTPRAQLEVELDIQSGDGALDEVFTVTLEVPSLDNITFAVDVPAADLQGSYLEGVTPETGYALTGLHLEGGFGVGFSGSHTTVPDIWNGFVAATVRADGSNGDVMQAHGYFPKETGM